MRGLIRSFEDFAVGDWACFKRVFTLEDARRFAELSGEHNPLHHEPAYDTASESGRFLLPVHLTTAPFSHIAGTYFPGTPSLCLSHKVEILEPAFFDEELTYSARIESINRNFRVMTLSVRVIRKLSVLLAGEIVVQPRLDRWTETYPPERHSANAPKSAAIIGADREVGAAFARCLARSGWNLVLQYEGSEQESEALAGECRSHGVEVRMKNGSLSALCKARSPGKVIGCEERPQVVACCVHPAGTSLEDILASLRQIASETLHSFLPQQSGAFLLILPDAGNDFAESGNDAAFSSMASDYMSGLHRQYSMHGVRCLTFKADAGNRVVHSLLAKEYPAILPEQVADCVAATLVDSSRNFPCYIVSRHGCRGGQYGFAGERPVPFGNHLPSVEAPEAGSHGQFSGPSTALDQLFRAVLNLDPRIDPGSAELGVTPRWDSLRHIKLLLEIEDKFGVRFTSEEIEQTRSYAGIQRLVSDKIGTGA